MRDYSASYVYKKNDTLIKHNNGGTVIEEKREHMLWGIVQMADLLNDPSTLL